MNLMPTKSPEQIQMEENQKAQKDMWIQGQRQQARHIAIEIAKGYNTTNASEMLKDASEIYGWIVQDLK
jgi:hypothetical protein